MPRQARQASGTGIYHVMMRGINHQNIFEEQEDYYQILNTSALERDFGLTPKIPLREGLRKFAEWYKCYYRSDV